jgi:hypothetical protein
MNATASRSSPGLPALPLLCYLFFFVPVLFLSVSAEAQCGTCTYTESALTGPTPLDNIPAGATLCITQNTCVGAASAYPATCANPGAGSLVINGTLRICDGVTLDFAGTIAGNGAIQIMSGGRLSLYGTYSCGITMTAVDPGLLSGTSTSTSIGGCNSSACEPHFADGYAPFGVVATGLGYTVSNGTCAITGVTEDVVLPLELLQWTAAWQDSAVLLNWSTPGDDQSYQYAIDYSKDGVSWQTLPKPVPGAGGSGIHDYAYLAPGPFAEHNFFRLQMQRAADMVSYSPIKELEAAPPGTDGFSIGPNPVHSLLTIRTAVRPFTLQVLDITGALLLQLSSNSSGQYNLEGLPPGAYFLVIRTGDGSRWVRKLTKL